MKIVFSFLIRLRFVIFIVLLVIIANALLAMYNLKQFEAFTIIELRQEGLLLAHALEAGIASSTEAADIPDLQMRIDRFVAARDYDIELNIILLEGEKSRIVASNVMDNIEETSPDEHQDLISSLQQGTPVVFIGEDNEQNDDDDEIPTNDESFDFRAKNHLNIMVPLIVNGSGIGSINARLSLDPLYKKKDAMSLSILIATIIEIILVLAGLAILTGYLIEERSKFIREETSRFQAELKALQAQINPHFLFNTLNSLSVLISEDPELAEDLTIEMADLYRSILGASKKVWWTISDEIDLIKNYLNIESIRLKEKLEFSIIMSPGSENIRIPCLIIEPLVENSIKHGINTAVFGGKVKIDILLNESLTIKVEDMLNTNADYPLSGDRTASEKTGIENIKKRLRILYGEKANFSLNLSRHGAVSMIIIKDAADFDYDKI